MMANVRCVDLSRDRLDARQQKFEPRWERTLKRISGYNAMRGLFHDADVKLSRPVPGIVTGHSFPSAHAFNNFCIAMVLSLFYRRWGWFYFIPACIVAYSRMYVGAHWPGDVIGGAFLGTGVAFLTVAFFDYLWRSFGHKVMPKTYAAHPNLLA